MRYTREEQKEHRAMLVIALRSGDYEQGRNTLRDGDRYCCLGVACDISGLGEWASDAEGKYTYTAREESESGLLPIAVKVWLGFDTISGVHFNNIFQEEKSLSELNDEEGFSFDDIADIIESEAIDLLV